MGMRSFVLALLLASTTALVVSPLAVRRAAAARSPMHIKMGVEDVAANCLEEGCPIDMLEDLIVELKAKKGDKTAAALVKELTVLLKSPEDNMSEIEKLVGSASARSRWSTPSTSPPARR